MRIPDFVLTEDFEYRISIHDSMTLPAGAFIKPIQYYYVPQHIKDREKDYWFKFDPEKEIYCYSSKGIFPIPLNKIRQV